jgi:hypothetical protein
VWFRHVEERLQQLAVALLGAPARIMNWDNATTADSWPGRPNKRTMCHFMRANGLSALTDVSSRICLPNPLEIYLHATNTQFVSHQSFHIIRANMRRPAHDWPDLLDAAAEPSCSMFSALCASHQLFPNGSLSNYVQLCWWFCYQPLGLRTLMDTHWWQLSGPVMSSWACK